MALNYSSLKAGIEERYFELKYAPGQARVPGGRSGGGQFASGGSSGSGGGIGGGTPVEWLGGKPSEDDRFEENAKVLGLTVKQEKLAGENFERDYVKLERPALMYHATTKKASASVEKDGIKPSNAVPGQQAGVYLSSKHIGNWHGTDTHLIPVVVPKGTKVYKDFQPNAVFVLGAVPKSWIAKH